MSDEQEARLDDLLDAESGLTGWELDFVDDLDRLRDRALTTAQADKLAQVWDRVIGGGR